MKKIRNKKPKQVQALNSFKNSIQQQQQQQQYQVYKSAGQEDSSIALMFLFSSLTSAVFGSLVGIVSLPFATFELKII